MSEYEDWLKGEIEKSRKSGLTFVLCGIGLLIVMIIMIIMFKNALPVTFMSIICIFTIAAGSKLKDFFRYRRELRKYYQRQQEDFVKNQWREYYQRFKYGESWWQEQQKKRQQEQHQQYRNQIWESLQVRESYAFLGLEFNSGEEEVKRAFRQLAIKYHPDHGGNAEKFKLLVYHRDVIYRYLGVK